MNIEERAGNGILTFLILACIVYLIIGTGLVSDDFDVMCRLKDARFSDTLIPKGNFYFMEEPLQYFAYYIWYALFKFDYLAPAVILKTIYILMSLYCVFRFFRIYTSYRPALLLSFFFIFYPNHDATAYWLLGQHMMLTIALYLYAFYHIHYNRLLMGSLIALCASFLSYGSPAIAASLALLFVIERSWKKAFYLIAPNLLYICYYLYMVKLRSIGADRVIAQGPIFVAKQFALQIATFIDSSIGPSLWCKIWYAWANISLVSAAIGSLAVILFLIFYRRSSFGLDGRLVFIFSALILISFLMFSLTGHYPQLAFTLGNRVMVYSSLLAPYVIFGIVKSRFFRTVLFAILFFAILGISDHWKNFTAHEQVVIERIRDSQCLKEAKGAQKIFVIGNQYSAYGPLCHIEFLSEGWAVGCLFDIFYPGKFVAYPFDRRYEYRKPYIIDNKYGTLIPVGSDIAVYDSDRDALSNITVEDLTAYIGSLPVSKRHWIYAVKSPALKNLIIWLMPRLKYAFL